MLRSWLTLTDATSYLKIRSICSLLSGDYQGCCSFPYRQGCYYLHYIQLIIAICIMHYAGLLVIMAGLLVIMACLLVIMAGLLMSIAVSYVMIVPQLSCLVVLICQSQYVFVRIMKRKQSSAKFREGRLSSTSSRFREIHYFYRWQTPAAVQNGVALAYNWLCIN